MPAGSRDSKIEVLPDAIGHVLRDRLLTVPVYQRSYSWERDEVLEFWRDIIGALKVGESEYFLGTVVVSNTLDAGRLTIIDGQQRLATASILIASIRDLYLERGEELKAGTVEMQYLASRDLETDDMEPRLHLNSEDDEYFRRVIVDRPGSAVIPELYPSHRLIRDAKVLIAGELRNEVNAQATQWIVFLSRLVKYLDEAVRLILVQVPSEEGAFQIFETLNDRGLPLTISDLLKNYLFKLAGRRIEVVRSAWFSAVSSLDLSVENSRFIDFLRHYWSSINGVVRERDLFRSMKEQITSEKQAVDFALETQRAARWYAALLNSDHEYWSELGTEARSDVETLLRLGLEQPRPLLLAAMQHFTSSEMKRLVRALVSWPVRGIIVGGIGGGTAERMYSESTVKVRSGQIKNTTELFNEISSYISTDQEFENAFRQARVPSARLARYLLLALERGYHGEKEPEFVANADEGEVNLEHVLPRDPVTSDWTGFTADELSDWVARLGNLVLIKKTVNQRLGNRPFPDKSKACLKSQLALTKMISSEADWTPEAIQRRQDVLAKLAPKVWPRSP